MRIITNEAYFSTIKITIENIENIYNSNVNKL